MLDVLVIDDDEVSRELVMLFVSEAGYGVCESSSGDGALAMLGGSSSRPDAVLADMQMIGTTGNALAQALREVCGTGTRLIAMSGSEPRPGTTAEFDGFLLKPMTVAEIQAAVEGVDPFPSAEDEESEGGALNEATYESLVQGMPPEQLLGLYGMCLDDAERRIGQMRQAVAEGDAGAYERAAHAIKGGCGMVGAVELARLAGAMEENGFRNGSGMGGDQEPLEQFMDASARLRRILDARRSQVTNVSSAR
jgi:CheY-like chemotaxis protein/HPt (histidine-containing phosphotransfer) domain-containing protein